MVSRPIFSSLQNDWPNQGNNFNMNQSDLIMRLVDLYPQFPAQNVNLAVKVILDSMSAAIGGFLWSVAR
jgi:hypothetical protein